MSERELKAAFAHAKKHIIEAINDAIAEEHHTVMEVDGAERRDVQAKTERFMERFLKIVKQTTLARLR